MRLVTRLLNNPLEEQRRREAHEKRYNDTLNKIVSDGAASREQWLKEQQESERKAAIADHEAALREQMLEAFVQANGSETGFADAYPSLRAAHVQAATLARMAEKKVTSFDVVSSVIDGLYRRDKADKAE